MLAPTTDWARRISEAWRASLQAVFETGRLLTQAKAALDHGEFGTMIENDLPFGARTAQMMMAIASDARLTNPKHVSHLPPHWGTLYELTKLDDEQFEAGISKGVIRPDMERQEAIHGARAIMSSRLEPDDSLDYFPTPPWATRALVERVLPHLKVKLSGTIREPACGEGHIAEVLRGYGCTVIATDIHDYGYGDGIADFLSAQWWPDWYITNPPFEDAAIAFALRAIEFARTGVAMFFRSQWAVEGVERYETLFRDSPPTLCAFFVERVNLCKGRWEPGGSTATAYCWLVWIKDAKPKPTFWIPPGCRKALTHDDDAERFTTHPVTKRAA
jgi:hypothetical protein